MNSRPGGGLAARSLSCVVGEPHILLTEWGSGLGSHRFPPSAFPLGRVDLVLFEALSLRWLNSGCYSRLLGTAGGGSLRDEGR